MDARPTARVLAGGPERVGELEHLWAAMHARHSSLEAMPPVRPVADSWARRRPRYEAWLSDGSGRLLIAEADGTAVGYAFLTLGAGTATWELGERLIELESLAVAEAHQARGVGSLLLAGVRELAAREGARSISVGVAHANEGAIRFYEREGFRPFYVQLLARAVVGEPD